MMSRKQSKTNISPIFVHYKTDIGRSMNKGSRIKCNGSSDHNLYTALETQRRKIVTPY